MVGQAAGKKQTTPAAVIIFKNSRRLHLSCHIKTPPPPAKTTLISHSNLTLARQPISVNYWFYYTEKM
jgi:hypothetical protein